MTLPGHSDEMEAMLQGKTFGASWHMLAAEADAPLPLEPATPIHEKLQGVEGGWVVPPAFLSCSCCPWSPPRPSTKSCRAWRVGGWCRLLYPLVATPLPNTRKCRARRVGGWCCLDFPLLLSTKKCRARRVGGWCGAIQCLRAHCQQQAAGSGLHVL